MTLESEITRYKQTEETRSAQAESLSASRTEAQDQLQRIRHLIEVGETTGDKIRDHVILRVGFNEELEQRLHKLEGELQSHEGEFVLVISRSWRQTTFDAPAHKTRYRPETSIYLGVIEPPFIDLQDDGISTTGHVLQSDFDFRRRLHKSEDNISAFNVSIYRLGHTLGQSPGPYNFFNQEKVVNKPRTEIIVGDEAVTNWFVNEAHFGRMPDFARARIESEPNSEIATDFKELYYNPLILIAYWKMQRMLGRRVEMDESQQEEIENAVSSAKESIIESLTTGKLNQYNLQETLQEAQELGMHEDPSIIERDVRPGINTVIDVPELIKGYLEQLSARKNTSQELDI